MEHTHHARVDYAGEGLTEDQAGDAPFGLVQEWLAAAYARAAGSGDVPEPGSMAVASVDEGGHPNVRTVLLRFVEPGGLGFVTSLDSAKGREFAARPVAALTLTWPAMFRAIRMRGSIEEIAREEIEAYFRTRPWGSRISAWTSEQSAPVASRAVLEERYAEFAARWPDTGSPTDVPVPPRWGGFRIVPDEVEFWAGRSNRLHDRLVFSRVSPGGLDDPAAWSRARRQP
ncbi:pyridoxamine 5'-phosphate oxidase [Nostocoides jenkinsii]|uniref:Pyridoxine/pyridoxamine 5'-phosphate oxidase n=1 Tax=Nostocoides jenkinsii Ben 74 TaxID=1193518 RepID=A0A077MFU5_9MICO|nr:pyridoxamine 5'-phosphate oxidase [Tetrasphaera jenkinsii]CCI55040.1 Pyridoxine/pyridoxamine 5'-phosphate oxidase [Tetrasphaera jenkinsii Ben 74]